MKITQEQTKQLIRNEVHAMRGNISHLLLDLSVRGFEHEPNFFIHAQNEGLAFGYYAVRWEHGHLPVIRPFIHHYLAWDLLRNEDLEEVEGREPLGQWEEDWLEDISQEIVESFSRVLSYRKRQYKTCIHCRKRKAGEYMHNDILCQGCAQTHLGVIY